MNSYSKYHIFCKVYELGSFTAAAEELGYTQSAVSQVIRGLEAELGSSLLERRRDGIRLTSDGQQYLPFFRSLIGAETALFQKQQEMSGLENSTICIDTFTSVSRNILPRVMSTFRTRYPDVKFNLRQGGYASIHEDINEGRADLGFLSASAGEFEDIERVKLFTDDMVAVLPKGHPLAGKTRVSLGDLAACPFILLDELSDGGGGTSRVLDAFAKAEIAPLIEYQVYDDYTILEMIRQGLGVSVMFRPVLRGFARGLEIRELNQKLERPVDLAWKNWETLPLAAKRFAEYIMENINKFI